MIRQYLLIFIFLFLQLSFAQENHSELINKIKSDPSLLNTPQAQKEMLKRGLTKDAILKKIQNTEKIKDDNILLSSENNNTLNKIQFDENNDTLILDKNNTQFKSDKNISLEKTVHINPLKYHTNSEVLKELSAYQVDKKESKLERYSLSFFKNKNSFNNSSLPVPSYYLINSGDELTISLFGATNDTLKLTVDNNGNINIPRIGPLNVSGKTYKSISSLLKNKLKQNYTNTEVMINISHYSTIQVSLVGDIKVPGLYNINALSTVQNLLIEAQGVKETGSLREVIIKRDNKILAILDFYKLLNSGEDTLNILLKSGDVVFIPKATSIVSLNGAISNPAKYELKNNENLDKLLEYAGGIKFNGSKYGFLIKRYINNEKLKTYEINLEQAKNFALKNGDSIYVYAVDKIHKESIYLYGNVVRPGERSLNKDLSLHKLLQKEINNVTLKGVFLEQTLFNYAMIKRETKTLEKEIISFNLQDVLNNNKDFKLKNNDELYIFNKYNSKISPYVTIKGESVVNTGPYNYFKNMKVKDLINIAGSTPYTKIRLTTYNTKDFMPQILFVNEEHILSEFDEIELFDYYMKNEINTFNITGAVYQPNEYILNKDISLSKAIEIAGGFTKKAYLQHFEIIRYSIENSVRKRTVKTILLDQIDDFTLKNDDEIKVFTIPNWNERKTITLKGEVQFPGMYTIKNGEKLSSVIKRAGGFTQNAFLEGSLFTRESIKTNEEKRIKESVAKLKQQMIFISTNGREAGTKDSSQSDLMSTIKMLEDQTRDYVALGRLVIFLEKDLNKFAKSEFNIKLEDKDTLTIPSLNDTISIYGEVLNPNTFVYNSALTTDDYIKKAGGITQRADQDFLYVVLANGEAESIEYDSWFSNGQNIEKGSTIIVPMKINSVSNIMLWKDVSQIIYQLAITAASLNTVGAI